MKHLKPILTTFIIVFFSGLINAEVYTLIFTPDGNFTGTFGHNNNQDGYTSDVKLFWYYDGVAGDTPNGELVPGKSGRHPGGGNCGVFYCADAPCTGIGDGSLAPYLKDNDILLVHNNHPTIDIQWGLFNVTFFNSDWCISDVAPPGPVEIIPAGESRAVVHHWDGENLTLTLIPPESIPTLSQWGIIALGMLSMIFGVVMIRQRKTIFA